MTNSSFRPSVLCVSWDRSLCETRSMVLAAQYDALCVTSVDQMATAAGARAIDVILLCHSLPTEESRRAVRLARELWPRAKMVAVSVEGGGVAEGTDQVVRGLDGPRHLLEAISHLLPVAC